MATINATYYGPPQQQPQQQWQQQPPPQMASYPAGTQAMYNPAVAGPVYSQPAPSPQVIIAGTGGGYGYGGYPVVAPPAQPERNNMTVAIVIVIVVVFCVVSGIAFIPCLFCGVVCWGPNPRRDS